MKRNLDVRIGTFFHIALTALGAAGCSGHDAIPAPAGEAAPGTSRSAPSGDDALLLPVYRVIGPSADKDRAAELADALGLEKGSFVKGITLQDDGAIRYVDQARFQRVPTRKAAPPVPGFQDERGFPTTKGDDALDFQALKQLRVLSEQDAAGRAMAALDQAGLTAGSLVTTGHALLEAVDMEGNSVARAELDTQVSFRDELEGLRLIGPGAKVKVTFDAEGVVTHLLYARREIVRGEEVTILGRGEAEALCAAAFEGRRGDGGGNEGRGGEGRGDEREEGSKARSVQAELVYYAPPLSRDVTRIVPHYVCSGKRSFGDEGVDLRKMIIPAIKDAPKASLSVEVSGASVSARASVVGGTAPYRITWASSTRSLDSTLATPVDASRMEYTLSGPLARAAPETLSLYVSDADGLVSTASSTFEVTPAPATREQDPGPEGVQGTIGTEWIGTCGGLDAAAANVDGFVNGFKSAGIGATFNWGDGRAWEIDFKDASFGGQDTSFADSVDLTFYTGHANGTGFLFCSNVSDGFLRFTDAHWGNSNLEWLVIAACGPLQDDHGAWRSRWGGAFEGLHLLLGYGNESFDDVTEGATFAKYLLAADSPMPVRQAWVTTATEVQPDDQVIYGVMGAYGPGWTMPNYDDHFWGKGPVGPDLIGSSRIGFWRISGTT